MAQKHLHELLTEAQEPFLLENYIADKRSKLKLSNSLIKKTIPFPRTSLCNQSCFFSHTDSPIYTNSPFSGLPSPAPVKNRPQLKISHSNLSLLLEAAEKIKSSNLGKPQKGNGGLSLFGSIIKKILKPGVKCDQVESRDVIVKNEEFEIEFDCSSCSSRQYHGEYNGEESIERNSDTFSLSEKCFCSSPVSTFLSSVQNSPSTCLRSPEYLSDTSTPEYSLAISPIISDVQGEGEVECIPKKHSEDEEKDQFSPVSILDPPFEDATEQHQNEEDEDDYNMDCSYALVQRAKEQLLERLLRFEKLAGLDPVELERTILETKTDYDDDDDDDDDDEELEGYANNNSEKNFKLNMTRQRLITDHIAKNKRKGDGIDERKIAAKMVCRRVGSWEKLEFKTKIDMVVEFDFKKEVDQGWKTNDHEILEEISAEFELSIFDLLVEELL